MRPGDEIARFRSKVGGPINWGFESPCLPWQGQISKPDGYGVFHLALQGEPQRQVKAHRYAYALRHGWDYLHGSLIRTHEIDHLCNQRACVEVSHLEWVESDENKRRRDERAESDYCVKGLHLRAVYERSWPSQNYCSECKRLANARRREARA